MEAKRLLTTVWLMMLTSVFAITSMAQVTTVQVNEVGTLWETLDAQGIDISTVTDLKVIGPINNSDFRFMRSFLPALVSADLADSEFDEVPGEAFRENTHLRTLRLPANITRISEWAFYHCDALESVSFGQMDLETGKVVFPASLTSMGGGAFEHCIKLQTADFSACTDLGVEGFYQCSKLTEVILPVTGNIRFGGNCFMETDIEELILTPAVTWLESNSLPYSLKTLIVESKSPINSSVNAFDNVNRSRLQIWVPQGTRKKYALADGWYNVNNLIREYNVKVNIQGEGTLLDGMTALNTGSVFLHGDQTTLTAQPTEGYTLQSATLAGQMLAINDNTITLPNPAVEGTLTVVFVPNVYTLTIEVTGNGTVLRDGVAVGSTLTMAHGESTTFTLNPADGLSVQSVEFNGEESVLQNGGQTYTTPAMTGDATLHVIFGNNDIQNTVQMTVVTGDGGTVIYKGVTLEPTSVFRVKKSEVATFTFAPVKGMRIDKVLLNDTDLTDQVSNLQFSISNLTDDAQMEVTFTSASNLVINNPNGGELNDLILAQGGNAKQVTSLKVIGKGLLRFVKLPTTVTIINVGAFANCNALTSIEGCENVKEIGSDGFANCSQLKNFPFGDKLTHLHGWNTLYGCNSLPKDIVMPASLQYLGPGALNYSDIESVDLSQCVNLEAIDNHGVGSANTVILPEKGSFRLGDEAFRSTRLTEVTLPRSVNALGNSVMPSTLCRLYVCSSVPVGAGGDAFSDVNIDECELYVPIGSSADYQLASGWFRFDNVEEFGFACSISGKGSIIASDVTYSDKDICFPVVGTATTFQIVPDVGYEISSVKFNNQAISLADDNTYTIGASVIKGRLEVQFVQKQLTATLEIVGAGSITIDGQTYTSTTSLPVSGGSVLDMVLTPNDGNFVKQILLNGEEVTFKNGGLAYTTPEITENSQIKVVFADNSELANLATVTVGMAGFGTIRYKGLSLDDGDTFLFNKGDDLTLEVLAEDDADAQLTSFLVNDVDVTSQVVNNIYTMANVTNDIAIEATFFSVTHLIVNNPNGGELNDQILAQGGNARKLTSLKVYGTLNAKDWTIIQNFMTSLEEIDLSETNITEVPENAFNAKGNLQKVILPLTTKDITENAFSNCGSLKVVIGCDNIEHVGRLAFEGCGNLSTYPFGERIQRIDGWGTFRFCTALPKDIVFGKDLKYLYSPFTESSVKTIDMSACTQLECIDDIGGYGTDISSIILPQSGSYRLGGEALLDTKLTDLILPANINRIDGYALPATLQSLYVQATTPIDADANAFQQVNMESCVLYVPTGSATDYQLATGWVNFLNIQEFGFPLTIHGAGSVKCGECTLTDGDFLFPIPGKATQIQFVPAAGYELGSATINGNLVSIGADGYYTIDAALLTGNIEATFTTKDLAVGLEIEGSGTVTIGDQNYRSNSTLNIDGGTALQLTMIPDEGSFVKQILFNGGKMVLLNGGTSFTTPELAENAQIKIVFADNSEAGSVSNITLVQAGIGSIQYRDITLASGDRITVDQGENVTFDFVYEGDSYIEVLLVNGEDVLAQVVGKTYTLENVSDDISVEVSFFSTTHLLVDNPNGGELGDLIVGQGGNARNVKELKVNGKMTPKDWTVIKNLMNNLEEIDLSGTDITEIPEYAFDQKHLLKKVKLPTTVTRINGMAFHVDGETALETIEGCDNVEYIGGDAFSNRSSLKTLPFGDKIKEFQPSNALHGCISLPKNLVLPASLTYLGHGAFNETYLHTIDLRQCVRLESIEWYAVGNVSSLLLPETGSFRLGGESLRGAKFTELVLPACVNRIDNNVMPSTLKRLYVKATRPIDVDQSAFDDVNLDECVVYVPVGSQTDYQLASGWGKFSNIEEAGFTISMGGKGSVQMNGQSYSDKEIFFPVFGTATTFKVVPAPGYQIASVKFNGQDITLTDDNTYTLDATIIKGTLAVQFTTLDLALTLDLQGAGTCTVNGRTYSNSTTLTIDGGSTLQLTLTPDEGNFVKQILLNSEEIPLLNGGTSLTTSELTENTLIKVIFANNSEASSMANIAVDIAGYGGVSYRGIELSDGDKITLAKGQDASFDFVYDDDSHLEALLVNGEDVTAQVADKAYTLENITSDITLSVSFFSSTRLMVDNPNGGELNDLIIAQGSHARNVKGLKVNGKLTSKDWSVIQNLMSNLEEIDLSATNITEVPEGGLRDKPHLTTVKLPATVTQLRHSSFRDCPLLSVMEGCDNVEIIGPDAFVNCTSLPLFPFGNRLQVIQGWNPFDNCHALPKTVILPATFRDPGPGAFANTSIETVDMSRCINLENVYENSMGFATRIILPESGSYGVGYLGETRLTELILPACVNAFDPRLPSTLKRLYVKATTPFNVRQDFINEVNLDECVLYVPTGSLTDYQLNPEWSNFIEKILDIQEYGLRVKVGSEGKVKVGSQIIIGESGLFLKAEETATLQIIPQTGWHVSEVKLNGTAISFEDNRIILNGEQATGTLTISFAINTFDFAIQTIGDGQVFLGEELISNGQVLSVDSASVKTFTLQPATGKAVTKIIFNGEESLVQNGGTTYVTPAITRASALQVTFSESGEQGDFVAFNVKTGDNGTVEYKNTTLLPQTSIQVPKGQEAVFIFKPNQNYVVQSLIMNGEDITDQLADNKLTIPNVAAAAQMEVTFQVQAEIYIAMEQEGLLSNMFNEETRQKTTRLTISGPLNDSDFRFMRDELPMLSELDLWDSQCYYIPDEAFCISNDWDNETGKQTLTKVRLPECTCRIGYRAFAGCTNLSEVNFEDLTELNDIAGWAFTNTGLRRADLSYTRITDLGDCQFRKARKMEHLALPNTITNIGNAFQENSILTEVDLSNCTNLTNINDAFYGSRKLVRVVLPEGLKVLNSTFNECSALANINFPSSLEVIGDATFQSTQITSADLKGCTQLQRINSWAFNNCKKLANVTFPSNLQRIYGGAFHECDALTAVDMSQLSLTEIEGSLFCWCDNLESVKLPKTVVTIRDNAFRGTKLSGILELPAALTTIEHDAFSSTQITIIKIAATNPPALATENEDGENVFSSNVAAAFVPEGCANRYKEAPVWEDLTILDREVQAEVTVTHEGNLAIDIMEQTGVAPGLITHLKVHGRLNATDFAVMRSNMTLLYDLDMEDADVSVIPENAFLDKKILMNVKLPESLLVIQENAFKGCSALSGTLILPSGVTTIGWAAFQGCTSLNGIVFSDALEVIRSYAFEGCVNLTQELTFPDQLLSIGEYAFANCRNLFGKVKFNSEFYQFIGAEGYWSSTGRAFENCSNIDEVDLSECEYLYEIPSATFNECYALKTVKLPPYLERIDDYSFHNCTNLATIAFPQSLLVINRDAFNGCSSLRSVDLSSCKTFGTIEGYAFSGCSSLETVNLPKSLNWIQEYAFNECRKLANLNVEALQPADLGEYVFRRVNTEKCVLSIPTGVYYDYLTAAQWGAFVQMRNAIDITLDEGANLSYTNNANVNADDSPNHAPRRRPRRAAAGVEQTGEANVKDGTSLYVSEDESVTFYINPEENVSIKQVLFNGEDVTDQLIGNAFETPKVTETSSFKVLLNVDGPITVKELRMTETEIAIKVAESHQILATVYPNNATNKTILWSSSDEEVAKVAEDGTVTGMKAGRATITACTEDGNFTQTCEVVVMSNDYYVMLSDQETFVQNEVRMPLVLHNTDNASGIQFDVYMPEGISLDPYRVEMSGRNNGHNISAAHRSDGSVRVIVYSNEGNAFLEHDGELLILPLTTAEETGEFVVDVKNIHISGPNSFDFVAPNYSARILVSDYPLGDSNGNGEVTVSDIVNTVDELLERQPERFIRKAADVNKDGIITVSDITATVDIILETPASPSAGSHGRRKAAQYGDDKLFINDFDIEIGQQATIMLELDNITEYTAFQCDLFLPEGITIAKDDTDKLLLSMTGCKTASHVFSARYVSNGALRIIVYSMEDEAFNDSEEGVFSLTLEANPTASLGFSNIQVQNIRLVRCSDRVELMVPDTQTSVNIVEPDPTGVILFADDGLQVRAEGRELIVLSPSSTIMPLICVDGKNQMIHLQPGENRINIDQPGIYVIRGKKFIFK